MKIWTLGYENVLFLAPHLQCRTDHYNDSVPCTIFETKKDIQMMNTTSDEHDDLSSYASNEQPEWIKQKESEDVANESDILHLTNEGINIDLKRGKFT